MASCIEKDNVWQIWQIGFGELVAVAIPVVGLRVYKHHRLLFTHRKPFPNRRGSLRAGRHQQQNLMVLFLLRSSTSNAGATFSPRVSSTRGDTRIAAVFCRLTASTLLGRMADGRLAKVAFDYHHLSSFRLTPHSAPRGSRRWLRLKPEDVLRERKTKHEGNV